MEGLDIQGKDIIAHVDNAVFKHLVPGLGSNNDGGTSEVLSKIFHLPGCFFVQAVNVK